MSDDDDLPLYFIHRPLYFFNNPRNTRVRIEKYIDHLERFISYNLSNSKIANTIKLTTHTILERNGVMDGEPNKVARAIWDFGLNEIGFAKDPLNHEWFVSPLILIRATRKARKYPAIGDCLPGWTQLLSSNYSFIKVKEVQEGNIIIGMDGNPTKVTTKWNRGIKKTLIIKLNNGTSVSTTPEHKFFLENRMEIIAKDLKVGDSLLTIKSLQPLSMKIISISEGPEEEVYDISTENQGIYLPENDIVVHNCDDHVIAVACMLASVGIKPYIIFMAPEPLIFSHVLSGYFDGNDVVPIETTIKNSSNRYGEYRPHASRILRCPWSNYVWMKTDPDVATEYQIPRLIRWKYN